MTRLERSTLTLVATVGAMTTADPAFAQDNGLSPGDTAWMLTSTVIVLMMTIPGVALFYGGMVRRKNVLGTVMHSFAATCLITVVWMVAGYSLAFAEGSGYVGGLDRLFLRGMAVDATNGSIPESVFMTFQMTFAIITAALITGAVAERMKFSALLLFLGSWSILVYWHPQFVAVGVAEAAAQVLALKPVVAEPIEVGELLVRQLIELAVRPGGEADADEVLNVQGGRGEGRAFAGHEVGKRHDVAVAGVGADEVGVVDVGVIDVAPGLHLRLQLLDDVALLNEVVGDLQAGDVGEGAGEHLGFVGVRGQRLGDHADAHAPQRRRRFGEPGQFGKLLIAGEGGGLKLLIDPAGGLGGVAPLRRRRGAFPSGSLPASAAAEQQQAEPADASAGRPKGNPSLYGENGLLKHLGGIPCSRTRA